MAKYDFNSSRYAHLFGTRPNDRRLLSTVVNSEKIVGTNPSWYLTQGSIDPVMTPSDINGLATFTVLERELKAAPIASLRSPLGDTEAVGAGGLNSYSATIPDFITHKIVETAMGREEKERRFASQFGNDEEIMKAWVQDAMSLRTSMDSTMTWMTAQLMSTGKINYVMGKGSFTPVHKAPIPAKNFCKAGAKVWTDPDAAIITYMSEIEDKYRQEWGWYGTMKWQMTKKMFVNVFLKNKEVVEKVNEFRVLADLVAVTFNTLNIDVFNNAWEQIRVAYGLSPIEIVEEKEINATNAGETIVNGWADKVVVLRPAGDAVKFMRKQILDETYSKYLNNSVERNFAPFNNGLGMLVNTTVPNGMYTEWQTVVLFSAVPALVEFTKHVIVDTSTANS